MYQKLMLTIRTKFMNLNINELINKILSNNILISNLAKEEFLKRDLENLEIEDDILVLIINKLSIEELWYITKLNINNHFVELVTLKLNQILDYYQKLNIEDFLKKKNEGKIKLHLM